MAGAGAGRRCSAGQLREAESKEEEVLFLGLEELEASSVEEARDTGATVRCGDGKSR
jgi:hypothetical protein